MHPLNSPLLSIGMVALPIMIVIVARAVRRSRLPPSPPSDFILGHVRRIPAEYSWKVFASWSNTLGNIIYIHILGKPMLIINSAKVARDLFETRSANFSDRAHMVVINDIVGMGTCLPFLPYGERWRKQRRLMQRYFDPQEVRMFRPVQEEQAGVFMRELLAEPGEFSHLLESLVARVMMKVIYGYNATGGNDPHLRRIAQAAALFAQLSEAGGSIVDFFPILRHIPPWLPHWFPGVAVKRHALSTGQLLEEVKEEAMRKLLLKRVEGSPELCLLNSILDDHAEILNNDPELKSDVPAIGLINFMAGFDTTVAAMHTLLLFMALNPTIVKRAQAEIDEVTGSLRTPTLEDRGQLPYLNCIVKEVYRAHPVGPLDLPHLSVEPYRYKGWTIPGKTACIANIWAMMRDEVHFPDPNLFSPERHRDIVEADINNNTAKQNYAFKDRDPNQILFGFGRRICPGRFFADANVWLIAAKVLSVFDIGPYVDPLSGEKIYPEIAFQPSLVSGPKSFKCNIKPRSAKHIQLIKQEAANNAKPEYD